MRPHIEDSNLQSLLTDNLYWMKYVPELFLTIHIFQNIIAIKCTALDFEQYIQDNKTLLMNDPLRDILLYPTDDVSVSL